MKPLEEMTPAARRALLAEPGSRERYERLEMARHAVAWRLAGELARVRPSLLVGEGERVVRLRARLREIEEALILERLRLERDEAIPERVCH